jgi:hypothetical protein
MLVRVDGVEIQAAGPAAPAAAARGDLILQQLDPLAIRDGDD